jgi:hypothetical protein
MNNNIVAPDGQDRSKDVGRKDSLRTLGLNVMGRREALLKIGAAGLGGSAALAGLAPKADAVTALGQGAVALAPVSGDNAPALRTAIDLLGKNGGTVYLHPGLYTLNSPILLDTPARLKTRFVGAGPKCDSTRMSVNHAGIGIDCGTGTTQTVTSSPVFERISFETSSTYVRKARGIRFKTVNHSHIWGCTFDGFLVGVEYDATNVSISFNADASYHLMDGMCRTNNCTKAILVTANEGGFNLIGGHIICNKRAGDIGVDVAGGWQTRIYGTKFEGGNGGNPLGTGIRIRGGEGIRVSDIQSESSKIGVHVLAGKHHSISGYFSNYSTGCEAGVKVEAAATNVYVFALSGADDAVRRRVKNLSSSTRLVATNAAPLN